jgi:hypothetical protein
MPDSVIGSADLEKAQEKRAEMDDTAWWKPESGQGKTWGSNYVRVLPPHTNAENVFYYPIPIHYSVGPGKQILPCPRRAKTGTCPVCIEGFRLRGEGQEEAFKKLMPSMQAYMNVIALNKDGTPKDNPPRVRTWSCSRKVLDWLIEEFEENGDFTNLKTGKDIEVRRKGELLETEWRIKFAKTGSAVDYVEAVEEGLRDLTVISPYVSGEILAKAMEAPALPSADPWQKAPPTAALQEAEVKQPDEDRFGGDDGSGETEPTTPNDADREAARERLAKATSGDSGKE